MRLNEDAYIQFGLIDEVAAGGDDIIFRNLWNAINLTGKEEWAEKKLPQEIEKLMQERDLIPDAYDLRSFKDSPDPGVSFVWIATVKKEFVAGRKVVPPSDIKDDDNVISKCHKEPLCPSCGKTVTHTSVDIVGKNINGVKCKSCNQMYCIVCYNPAKRLLTCEKCGHKELSFLVDGR